jgi:hypothetical protein
MLSGSWRGRYVRMGRWGEVDTADWRVMQAPSRMETQRALVKHYGNYAVRFDEIAEYEPLGDAALIEQYDRAWMK